LAEPVQGGAQLLLQAALAGGSGSVLLQPLLVSILNLKL
jgi:hypothetical protein